MAVKPISPDEVRGVRTSSIPDTVIEAFNYLITKNTIEYGRSSVRLADVINEIQARMAVTRSDIYQNGWLNVEDLYRAQGWKVEYRSPSCDESFHPYMVFTRAQKRLDHNLAYFVLDMMDEAVEAAETWITNMRAALCPCQGQAGSAA